jgi:class 3 adenylate cyclase
VWDGREGDGPGGTASAVAQWNAFGCRASIINPREMFAHDAAIVTAPPPAPAAASTGFSGTMMALLFADVVGFSKLTEPEIPLFARYFLGGVAELIARSKHKPVQTNTWGDGLYFTFATASAAGQFALELRDFVVNQKWGPLGFRNELSLRTGLHVGPVYKCENPVTGREDYIGTHVSRAARIEPITPRGQVYASEVFAAIAFAQRAEGFTCDYVGKIGLAKDYGTYPTYHVRPKRPGR